MVFKKPLISLIAALGPDGLIGRKGGLIFHLPSDMKYFKSKTMGKPVVMGRKTYESIPEKFRPLPGRQNIVLTRDRTWKAEGVLVIHDFNDIYKHTLNVQEVMIAGGAEIYALALPVAKYLYITDIKDIVNSTVSLSFKNFVSTMKLKSRHDAFFPIVPAEHTDEWQEVSRIPLPEPEYKADWVTYVRI